MRKAACERLSVILVFGSIWGIIEATLGYALHLLPALIAGSVMFPLVMFILLRARRATTNRIDIILIGFLAAMIKSVNLLMPALNIYKTINPMVAIILQSLVVFAVVPLSERQTNIAKLVVLVASSIAWRGLFLAFQGVNFLVSGYLASQLTSLGAIGDFLIVGGLLSGVLVMLAAGAESLLRGFSLRPLTSKLWIGAPVFALAVILTIVL